jgi:hypothetical protein
MFLLILFINKTKKLLGEDPRFGARGSFSPSSFSAWFSA